MPEVLALVEVDWFREWRGLPDCRSCDLCGESAIDDSMAGKWADDFRRFWQESLNGGIGSGLTICENCLPAYLAEQPW